MTTDADPYRTLGLTRDATLDEVRRAYRRLAKANHPDAAGEAALPRFLAIQAAYDTIAGPDGGTRRPGSARAGGATGAAGARRPWDPDRDRTEATYRAYGGRARRARPTGASGPARGPSGEQPSGERPSRERPGADRPPGPRSSRPERPPNKATLGSTSYDGAEAEPFEPDWGGASWYGTTSGTYWTLNPKEYADPRKHGPEYQARARRQLSGWEEADGIDPGASATPPKPDPSASEPAATSRDEPGPDAEGVRPAMHTTSSWWEATAGHTPRSDGPGPDRAASHPGQAGRTGASARADAAPRSGEPVRSTGEAAGRYGPDARTREDPTAPAAGRLGPATDLTAESVLQAIRSWLDDDRPGAIGRIARAIVGWAPIALAIGWVGGEISGCGRFAAGCDDAVVMGAWLAQIAALVTLVVVARLARIASLATLATLAAAVPAALLLSATGSPEDTATGRFALSGLLVIAWAFGLVFGTVRELRGTALRRAGPPGSGRPRGPVS